MNHLSHHPAQPSNKDELKTVLNNLMLTYGQDVWNYALFLTKSKHLADDISQEVFLKAFINYDDFRKESSVKTWLLRITRNISINHMKTNFLRKVTLMDFLSPKGTYPSTEKEVLDKFAVNQVWGIVIQLPRIYREVIVLEAHYDLSDQEMASLLGISLGALKSRLHRARMKIEQELEALKNEE
ncbi:RNA polymerase sigma factor [Paenibacillus vandeheii]